MYKKISNYIIFNSSWYVKKRYKMKRKKNEEVKKNKIEREDQRKN